jgi:nucleoside-diphosphate-sugar epimerase
VSVHVLDVARAHVLALTSEGAKGRRINIMRETIPLPTLAGHLKGEFGGLGYFISSTRAPWALAKLFSFFDVQIRTMFPLMDTNAAEYDNRTSREVLGLTYEHELGPAFVDMGHEAIERGHVRATRAYRRKRAHSTAAREEAQPPQGALECCVPNFL